MDFNYSDEQVMVKNMLRDFVDKEIVPISSSGMKKGNSSRQFWKSFPDSG